MITKLLFENEEYPRFEIQYEFTDMSFTGTVYEINSWTDVGKYDESDKSKYLEGYIKWDGCSHFSFGDDNGYLHLCGKSYIDEVGKVLEAFWKLAEENIKNFKPC